MQPDDPILAGGGEGMTPLPKAQYRPYATDAGGSTSGQITTFPAGAGQVIISDLDLTSGLLGTSTWGIAGYTAPYAQQFVQNLLLWTIQRLPKS